MELLVLILFAVIGSVLIALAVHWRRLLRAIPLTVIGTAIVFFALVKIFAPDRLRGAFLIALLVVMALSLIAVLLLLAKAFRLWHEHTTVKPVDQARANLAIALGAGATVTVVILLIQTGVQVLDYQQNLSNQRQTIKLVMATESDLSGLAAPHDPSNDELLDMSGYWFRGKKMAWASLNAVSLRGTNFVFADLSGALMREADLSSDDGVKTDLRAASLYWSDLTDAKVGNASFVDADLRRAYLCGVDLRQANLTRTDLREAVLDTDPNTGEPCSEPGMLPPRDDYLKACWPDETDAHDGCGEEARSVVCQRDGRVPQAPAPDPNEVGCKSSTG